MNYKIKIVALWWTIKTLYSPAALWINAKISYNRFMAVYYKFQIAHYKDLEKKS